MDYDPSGVVIAGPGPGIYRLVATRWMRASSPRTADGILMRGHPRDPRRDQAADRRRRIAELLQHLFRVLAEHGRIPVDGGAVVVEQDRIAGGTHLAEPRVLDLLHHAAGDDLRIVEYLLEIVHARARHPGDS